MSPQLALSHMPGLLSEVSPKAILASVLFTQNKNLKESLGITKSGKLSAYKSKYTRRKEAKVP